MNRCFVVEGVEQIIPIPMKNQTGFNENNLFTLYRQYGLLSRVFYAIISVLDKTPLNVSHVQPVPLGCHRGWQYDSQMS